jgi:hypothetical protein
MTSPRRIAPRRPLGHGAWWLVLALLGAQWLGLAHGVLHAGHGDASRHAAQAAQAAHAAHDAAASDALFGHTSEEDRGACRLYDAVGCADALLVAELTSDVAPHAPPRVAGSLRHLAERDTPVRRARGPPFAT